ncbi:MAG: formate dehydrogenase accessory protein FdhE [Syntrophaceae bacterium]|nr:formate dehydrogenase accessory protein FdhE [Syntrophaceae bacterium]
MEKLRKRIQHLKKKRPGYTEILNFYQQVREEQEKIKDSLKVEPVHLKKEWKELLAREGFSMLERKDFPVDLEASSLLFHSLCNIAKEATPHMAEQVEKIREVISQKRFDLKKVFTGEIEGEKVADQFEMDRKVFLFLLHESLKPSLEEGVKRLGQEVDAETWLKGHCPICGSLPSFALLKGEGGKRYLLCSYCGFEWRIDRLSCPFCGNKERGSLQYFYAEGEEAYRIDLCEKCHQYIKTIDLRKIEECEPILEDVATLHLDILASQKGYNRPVPNPWTS